jgi:transposase InsO family protein
MSLKLEFIERAKAQDANISALCREFGITRQTGHKWIKRFEEQGYDGLDDRSRRPKSSPLALGEEVVLAVLEAREAHPRWGAKKLVVLLQRRFGEQAPGERTIARILDRFGKLRKRGTSRRVSVVDSAPAVDVQASNDVWTVDFKGWWHTTDGRRCEPLTIRDAYSRYVLAVRLLDSTKGAAVRKVFEQLFQRFGLPKAIQCDNGSPFVSVASRGGLTRLSAWWVSLGIQLVRSRPGCPQDNGAHERMHADMSGDLQASPADSRLKQQRACDRWRKQFNEVRPHEALQQRVPADFYVASPRRPRPRLTVYPPGWIIRLVNPSGGIRVSGETYRVSAGLAGHHIGLQPLDGLRCRVWFHQMDLGELEIIPSDLPSRGPLRSSPHRQRAALQ